MTRIAKDRSLRSSTRLAAKAKISDSYTVAGDGRRTKSDNNPIDMQEVQEMIRDALRQTIPCLMEPIRALSAKLEQRESNHLTPEREIDHLKQDPTAPPDQVYDRGFRKEFMTPESPKEFNIASPYSAVIVDNNSIRNAITTSAQLSPPLEGMFDGINDNRSASFFEHQVSSITQGLNSVCVFFYLKKWISINVWERIPLCLSRTPSQHDYEKAVEKILAWLKSTYDTDVAKERLLTKWKETKQEAFEDIPTYCARLRKLIRERTLMGIPSTEVEMIAVLRNSVRDSRIKFWLTLQHHHSYDTLESDLIAYSSKICDTDVTENGPSIPRVNQTISPKYNTGCVRCRDRVTQLHHPQDCTVPRPLWWSQQTCKVCGRANCKPECPLTARFQKRPCLRCGKPHSTVVCGMVNDMQVVNQVGDESGLPTLELQVVGTGTKIAAAIDTGSTDNIISHQVVEKIMRSDPGRFQVKASASENIFVADKRPVPVLGEITLPIRFADGSVVELSCLIVKHLQCAFLLSERTLQKMGCVWLMGTTNKLLLGKSAENWIRIIGADPHSITPSRCHCIMGPRANHVRANPTILPTIENENSFTSLIPWLHPDKRPSYNYHACLDRDRKSMQRLASDKPLLEELVDKLVKEEVLQPAKAEEIKHFLPLRVVTTGVGDSKKIRVTVDARTLNKYVEKGSNACKHMRSCFLHWRMQKFFICTDLSQAFYSIYIHDSDKPWLGLVIDGNCYQYNRLPMGLSYSPKALEQILEVIETNAAKASGNIEEHHSQMDLDTLASIEDIGKLTGPLARPPDYRCRKYVDDVHYGGDTREDTVRSCLWGLKAFMAYGFRPNPRKSFSNMQGIPWLSLQDGSMLGHSYEGKEDLIIQKVRIAVADLAERGLRTRSAMYAIVASSFYDPYGLQIEVGLRIKLLLAAIVTHSADWDAVVEPQIIEQIRIFAAEYNGKIFTTPRYIQLELVYVFVDASTNYWCVDIRDVSLRRIYSTTGRVPASSTIPRAELEALKRGIMAVEKLQLPYQKLYYLSDSMITIMRLRRPSTTMDTPWEARRVAFIRGALESQGAEAVLHISTQYNLADRGTKVSSNVEFDQQAILHEINRVRKEADSYTPESSRRSTPLALVATRVKEYVSITDEQHLAKMNEEVLNKYQSSSRLEKVLESQKKWNVVATSEHVVKNGIVYRRSDIEVHGNTTTELHQMVIPEQDKNLKQEMVEIAHKCAGHVDPRRTFAALRKHVYFKKAWRLVKEYCKDCHTCKLHKSRREWDRFAAVQQFCQGIWKIVGIDHAFLPKTSSNNGYLSVCDYTTKFVAAIPSTTRTSKEVISSLKQLFSVLGYPTVIVFDNSSSFESKEFLNFLAENDIKPYNLPAYAAESAGFFERSHRTLKQLLKMKLSDSERPPEAWPQVIAECVCQVNKLPFNVDEPRLTPATLVLGYEPRVPGDLSSNDILEKRPTEKDLQLYRDANMNAYIRAWEHRKAEIRQTLLKRGRKKGLQAGSSVMIYRPPKTSLSPCWQSGGTVKQVKGHEVELEGADGKRFWEHRINLLPINNPIVPPPV